MDDFERPALAFGINEPSGNVRNLRRGTLLRRNLQRFATGSLSRFHEIE